MEIVYNFRLGARGKETLVIGPTVHVHVVDSYIYISGWASFLISFNILKLFIIENYIFHLQIIGVSVSIHKDNLSVSYVQILHD